MTLGEATEAARMERTVRWWATGWRYGKLARVEKAANGHNIAVIKDHKSREVRHHINLIISADDPDMGH